MFDARVSEISRRLRARADVILGVVWYMPEATAGFPGIDCAGGVATLASRAACMGKVTGATAAAVFGALEPGVVAHHIDGAWKAAEPEALLRARLEASVRALRAYVPDDDEPRVVQAVALLRSALEQCPTVGHPMFAGLRALPWPGTPLGDLWRACDMVRERRGDSHVNAWVTAGLDPVEINVLSELWRHLPLGSVTLAQMQWSPEELDAALARLRARGLVTGETTVDLTDAGRALREEIERATDAQERPLVEALGEDADLLLALLDPWAKAIAAATPKM